MSAKKSAEREIIYFLFKDRTLLYAHTFFYVLLFITYRIVMAFNYNLYRSYSNNFESLIVILLVATLSVQVILFLSMLIKLFTKPKTHQLTSFLGLFIGIFICFIWFVILIAYFQINDQSWGLNGIGFMLVSFFPCVSSIGSYILLIIIKVIRSGIYLLIDNQNHIST